jgi:hypothetical protein
MNIYSEEVEMERWINLMTECNNNVTGELSGSSNNEEVTE